MDLTEEKELILKAERDPDAFGPLYDAYYLKIFNYVYRRVMDYETARDITAEVFLKAFLKIASFRWQDISISSWLYRIATNETNQFYRKKKYKPYYLNDLFPSGITDLVDPENEESLQEKIEWQLKQYEDFIRIQQLIITLPVIYQEVIILRFFENKNIRESVKYYRKKKVR